MPDFHYEPMFQLGADEFEYRRLDAEGLVETTAVGDREVLAVDPKALRLLAAEAVRDVSHLFRASHLAQLRAILDDPEASDNDRFVALEMLKNAVISSAMVLPSCQDTGTAIVHGDKGENVFTGTDDAEWLSHGIYDTYTGTNLRYSQMAPLSMFEERNTGTNLPAQIEIESVPGDEYELQFVTKGGGSANKTFLYQKTKAVLNPDS
ncbi:MAG: fumarate hydratase, partial [Actinomycetia bacterium]|nr:fumarate hydratase [Actinomycetes bacterium]